MRNIAFADGLNSFQLTTVSSRRIVTNFLVVHLMEVCSFVLHGLGRLKKAITMRGKSPSSQSWQLDWTRSFSPHYVYQSLLSFGNREKTTSRPQPASFKKAELAFAVSASDPLGLMYPRTWSPTSIDRPILKSNSMVIAFGGLIGTGVFVMLAKLIELNGSASCVVFFAYIIAGLAMVTIVSILGEMVTVWLPPRAIFDCPRTFYDPTIAFSLRVIYR